VRIYVVTISWSTCFAQRETSAIRGKLDKRTGFVLKKRSMLRIIPALALIATFSIALGIPAVAAPGIDAEIRAVLRSQQEAWNRGDIDGFMNGYARAGSTTFVSEDTVTRGWQTVRDRYRKRYSDREKMGTLTFSDLEITPLGRDAAIALGRWKLKRSKDEPHGRFTLIFRQRTEGWRIVHDHTSTAK
jgi:ketosteroid isomerase-like protein